MKISNTPTAPRNDCFAPKDSKHHGGQTFCVPFAVAYATGLSYDSAEELIKVERRDSNSAAVVGVNLATWGGILEEFGAKVTYGDRREWVSDFGDHDEFCNLGPTLARWHKELPADQHRMLKVLRMNRHVILVQGDSWMDNNSKEWRPLVDHPSRRSRVDVHFTIRDEEI